MTDVNIASGNNEQLSIGKFRFDNFAKDPAIVMIAKRGTGKSYIVREILEHFHDIPVGAIICPTELESPYYSKFFPSSYIHYKYTPHILEKIFYRQKVVMDKYQKHIQKGQTIDPRCILVMDDCMASKKTWANDELVKTVLMNGRHKKITYILTMQYPLGITPELRTNFDHVFILATDEIRVIKILHENFAGIFDTLEGFRQVFRQLTADFGAMVLIKRGVNEGLYDKVKWYRAKSRNDNDPNYVQMGCKQFRKFHEKNYDDRWQEKDGMELNEYAFRGMKKDANDILKNIKKGKLGLMVEKEE